MNVSLQYGTSQFALILVTGFMTDTPQPAAEVAIVECCISGGSAHCVIDFYFGPSIIGLDSNTQYTISPASRNAYKHLGFSVARTSQERRRFMFTVPESDPAEDQQRTCLTVVCDCSNSTIPDHKLDSRGRRL